jgi:hypothetical protein
MVAAAPGLAAPRPRPIKGGSRARACALAPCPRLRAAAFLLRACAEPPRAAGQPSAVAGQCARRRFAGLEHPRGEPTPPGAPSRRDQAVTLLPIAGDLSNRCRRVKVEPAAWPTAAGRIPDVPLCLRRR